MSKKTNTLPLWSHERAYPPLPSIAPSTRRDAPEVACSRGTLQGRMVEVASLAKTASGEGARGEACVTIFEMLSRAQLHEGQRLAR